ncbi:uncharacterized protein TNCV_3409581 [Trichonephila clavipes]|nr:uncharacterized protein TNCV_3409581 [Trichonephila clavipes]
MKQLKEVKEKVQKERDNYWKPIVADFKMERDVFKNEFKSRENEWKTERDVLKSESDTFKAEINVFKTERDNLLLENCGLRRMVINATQMLSDSLQKLPFDSESSQISPLKPGVLSEPDLICTPEAEILEGISGQGVIQPNKYPSITSVSTSSSTTQANLLPSASSIKPTTKIASRLPKPISSSAAPDNSLNTSASSLSAETRTLIRSNKSAALSTEIQPLPESDPTASNGEHFNAPEVPQCAKRNSRNRRKRPKVQKAEIKIKMVPYRPRKSTPTELTTDEEDMIMYDVQAEELEPNPEDKFAVMECFVNNPSEYMRALTPTRFRNSSN